MSETETHFEKLKREHQERVVALKARREGAPYPPSVQSLCLEQTLYAPVQLNPDRDEQYLSSIKFEEQQFDAYCIYCRRSATFRTLKDRKTQDVSQIEKVAQRNIPAKERLKQLRFEDGQFALHLGCTRNTDHIYSYFFNYDEKESILTKIGQMPSLEDVAGADIQRFRRILGDDFAELRKATGLYAHGIGIGSFVYLRRIFENLVENARSIADPKGDRVTEFRQMRMADQISELADFLPPAVVKYKETYGILSKGLHDLTEEDCKRHFPVVRAAVIMMLEQRYEAAEKAKAEAELERAVNAIASETKGT